MEVSAIELVVGDLVLNSVPAVLEDLAHQLEDGGHAICGRAAAKGYEPKQPKNP